jgi:hypothetical protein
MSGPCGAVSLDGGEGLTLLDVAGSETTEFVDPDTGLLSCCWKGEEELSSRTEARELVGGNGVWCMAISGISCGTIRR